mgnify:CR=1 FL=1
MVVFIHQSMVKYPASLLWGSLFFYSSPTYSRHGENKWVRDIVKFIPPFFPPKADPPLAEKEVAGGRRILELEIPPPDSYRGTPFKKGRINPSPR